MKLNGFVGKGTGKLGSSVFAVSGGEQIVRQYNPNVSNPSTDAQVEQRAKLKLMSQLAADLSGCIAYVKEGLVSARNKFVSANIGKVVFEDGQASIPFGQISVAPGSVDIPSLEVVTAGDNNYQIRLESSAVEDVMSVAYFVYKIGEEQRLSLASKINVTVAGEGRTFPYEGALPDGQLVVFGYGILGKTEGGSLKYEDYIANGDDGEAQLDFVRSNIGRSLTTTRSQATSYEV